MTFDGHNLKEKNWRENKKCVKKSYFDEIKRISVEEKEIIEGSSFALPFTTDGALGELQCKAGNKKPLGAPNRSKKTPNGDIYK